MSIRRNKNAYQVRVHPFKSTTAPTLKAAQKLELDLKLRRSLGDLYEEESTTLGEEIDGFLAWKRATAALSEPGYRHLDWSSRIWEPFRHIPVSKLRRVEIEDHITERAGQHRRSAKNELVFLKAVLRRAAGRGQRIDQRILAIEPIRHTAREGVALSPEQLKVLASVMPERIRRLVLLGGDDRCPSKRALHVVRGAARARRKARADHAHLAIDTREQVTQGESDPADPG